MVPQMFLYPLAIIVITGLYSTWTRVRPCRMHGPEQKLRDRVTFMLWMAAHRA